MKRRKFLKGLATATAAPVVLNSVPMQALAQNSELQKVMASLDEDNDRVLVLIQLHGGNDGLNMVVPIDQYSKYYNLRPNIGISDTGNRQYINLDDTLPIENQVGLHPDMQGIKDLYDQGNAAIVQAVAYDNMNQSHFRSRDIWFMGGDYDDYIGSGWMGRYLDHLYPGYPDAYPTTAMPDPLGIEIGNSVSLAFHRAEGIPTAISLQNPEQFHDLITSVGVNPPESITDTYYGEELKWIMDIEKKSNQYAGRLLEVYENGSNTPGVIYPESYHQPVTVDRFKTNGLSAQLKTIARMIKGGSKTKIFLCRMGGFDTHAFQVEAFNPSFGIHATLLYYISSAVKAFMDDLKGLGLDDRVMGLTFSEFGRRAASNGSYGTDHGTAAPMILFGKGVKAGVVGTNPDLDDLDGGNIKHQHDYRQVFTTVLQDWMCASSSALDDTLFSDFADQKLPLVENPVGLDDYSYGQKAALLSCFPNPVKSTTTLKYEVQRGAEITISIHESNGRLVRTIKSEHHMPGEYEEEVNLSDLPKGNYIYKLESKFSKLAKLLLKV